MNVNLDAIILLRMQETILILDFGSQYTQLIARRVRELNVYCEIHPFNEFPEINDDIKGVILSGSPFSVRDAESPIPELSKIKGKIPLLGVCYGAQFLAQHYGGEVVASTHRDYGRANLNFIEHSTPLFDAIEEGTQVWMSHGDTIKKLPDGYRLIGSSKDVENAAFKIENEDTYGIQFHPEVYHSTDGLKLLRNFVVDICSCSQDWTPASYIETTVEQLKGEIGNDKVILGLSGGVDSTVAATLISKAIGENLYCIFVDNGLLRKDEFESVLEQFKLLWLNVKGVDAKSRF
jgi:GMP synthase (glutamine-hydrolysing)